jgi:hypothetical protein
VTPGTYGQLRAFPCAGGHSSMARTVNALALFATLYAAVILMRVVD